MTRWREKEGVEREKEGVEREKTDGLRGREWRATVDVRRVQEREWNTRHP